MFFTRFVIPLLFVAAVILGGYWLWNTIRTFRIRRSVSGALRRLEEEYLDFMTERELLADLQDKSLAEAKDAVMSDALTILRPHIDALLGTLESIPTQQMPKFVNSDLFPNILSAYRNIWTESQSDAGFDTDDRKMFRQAMSDAMYADLSRRILMLQTGAAL